MFTLNIRFQIAAIIVLALIIIDYFRNPHLKVLSSKFFQLLLGATALNLFLDILTVYSITHINTVGEVYNRLFHQLFIGSIIVTLFMNYMYIIILGNDEKRLRLKTILLSAVPLLFSLVMIIGGRLYYFIGENYAYSHGPMASVVFACGILYLILSYISTCTKMTHLNQNQKISIRFGLCLWFAILIFQLLFPQYLMSGLGFVLLVLSIYFSYENPKENFDIEANCFNRNAFHKMMSEYYANGKPLFVVNIVCENYDRINSVLGHDAGIQALQQIHQLMQKHYLGNIYHSRSNVFSFFITEELTDTTFIEAMSATLMQSDFEANSLICRISVMDVRKYTSTKDEVYELINYLTDTMQYEDRTVYYLNEEIVNKKVRRDKIDQLLTDAVKNDGFEMVYQPIYWPKEQCFKSAEALIRMKSNEELGFISPEEFIPIAEEKGLIMEIGDMVVDMVTRFIHEQKLEEKGLSYIELNLSGIQVTAPDIAERIQNILKKNQVAPAFINLEITETATIDSSEMLAQNMTKLRSMGFSFSMDDFGTGYSNLAQMSQVSYDLIKIDKSLIWPVFYDKSKKALVLLENVITMLNQLGLHIVAEGVETKEMADYLIEKGVSHLQGYYYSKPIGGEAFLKMLE